MKILTHAMFRYSCVRLCVFVCKIEATHTPSFVINYFETKLCKLW